MKNLETYVNEKLKVTKPDYPINICADDFEYLVNAITDMCKSNIKDKSDFTYIAYHLSEYFYKCCKDKSEKWDAMHEVNGDNYNKHSMYFIQHYDINEFVLHYDKVSYYFTYKYSKFKVEKFEGTVFSYYCKYKGRGGYGSVILEFPENMITDFADNIDNNF